MMQTWATQIMIPIPRVMSVRFNLLLGISDGENEEHQHESEEQFNTKRSAHCYIVQEHVSCQLLTVSSRGAAVNDARTADGSNHLSDNVEQSLDDGNLASHHHPQSDCGVQVSSTHMTESLGVRSDCETNTNTYFSVDCSKVFRCTPPKTDGRDAQQKHCHTN